MDADSGKYRGQQVQGYTVIDCTIGTYSPMDTAYYILYLKPIHWAGYLMAKVRAARSPALIFTEECCSVLPVWLYERL
jgi:hypothetical protein